VASGHHAFVLPGIRLPALETPATARLEQYTAVANNNLGEVVGSVLFSDRDSRLLIEIPVVWDTRLPGNPVKALPLPPNTDGRAKDINDSGMIVGEMFLSEDPAAVAWTHGKIVEIYREKGLGCDAYQVNNANYVLGRCHGVDVNKQFLWHDDNGNQTAEPEEFRDGFAGYINDSNQIVNGSSLFHDDNGNGIPDPGETKDINALMIDTTYAVEKIYSINNHGQILAQGYAPNKGYKDLLLTPRPQPVIFVPGIAGSRLVEHPRGNAEELWVNPLSDRRRLSLFPSDNPSTAIEATDALRFASFSKRVLYLDMEVDALPVYDPWLKYLRDTGKFREYVVNDFTFRRTTVGCDLTQKKDDPSLNPDFFVFAYDWRKSNVENAAKLKDYVGCIKQFHPNVKIDIIAHSMGGLLSRRYILDNPNDHNVDKLITVGTPWLGAPKLLHVMETGEFIKFGPFNIAAGPELKYITPSLIGAHQLLPSRTHQEMGGGYVFAERGWDYDGNGLDHEDYDYDRLYSFLDKKYSQSMPGTVGPGTTGDQFHSHSTPSGKQDDWRKDSTSVNYFHFYGTQRKNKTIIQIVARKVTTCNFLLFFCSSKNVLEPIFSAGDGTVPEISAGRKSASLNLNASNAKLFRITNKNDGLAEHNGMLNNPDVQSAILTLLNGGTVSLPIASVPTRKSSGRGFAHHAQSDGSTLSYYISIIGGSSVAVSDNKGHSTAVIEGDLKGSVPDVDTFSMGTNAQMLVLPVTTAEQYNISFTTTDEPLTLRIVKGESNISPTNVINYQDVVLPAAVPARLTVTSANVSDLRYDSNGDGTYDTSVSQTLTLNGNAATDVAAPTIVFAASQLASAKTQVTITATDNNLGVRDIYYSTDGTNFKAYTEPLALDPIQTPLVFAFATDKASNRSAIISYSLASPGPVTIPVDTDNDGQPDTVDVDDDNDGQSDADEQLCQSDSLNKANMATDTDGDHRPNCVDLDDDGDNRPDDTDNCPLLRNPDQEDNDGDGIGDVCDETPRRAKSVSRLVRFIRWLLSPFR